MQKEKKDDVLYMDIDELFKGKNIDTNVTDKNDKGEKKNVSKTKTERR